MRNQIYYTIKPFVPRVARMAIRRAVARRKRRHVGGVWPILPGSERPPDSWSGWPEGKQFAFVITHDVEGPLGVRNTPALAALERELGFRSSYNFIPEGTYRVPAELRAELTRDGFEVGVHDLAHDGWLYRSRDGFRRNAARINGYLRDWNARGFRAGFMLHNLRWLHDLDALYDASTFDTDPFEPQPDGYGTIFPFWVPRPHDAGADGYPASKTGYLELPYTMPQDSTLFFLLGEQSAEVWINKLDWVAAHGGMALVNIHPDYLDFSGREKSSLDTFPVARVRELLEHVTRTYGERCWNPCAKDLAEWFLRANPPSPSAEIPGAGKAVAPAKANGASAPLQGKRAVQLHYSGYPSDLRPLRAAEALIEAGMEVEVICLRESDSEPSCETIGGVNVRRLRVAKAGQGGGKLAYLAHYAHFIGRSAVILTWRALRRRYDLVHVHNMPDILVFAALGPKLLRGARVILDLHDPMPELLTSIYGLDEGHWLSRVLRTLERWSIRFADLALTPNVTFKNLFLARGCPPEKMQVVMNSPQARVFDPDRVGSIATGPMMGNGATGANGAKEFRLMHHGTIAHRHGVDLLVEALARVAPKVPGVRLDIYGPRTAFLDTVLAAGQRLGVAERIRYHGNKTQEEIVQAIRECDLGVIPNRRSVFTDLNFPMRLFEYLAMRRLVIAPATRGIRDYFRDDQIVFFEREDVNDLAAKILWVAENPHQAGEVLERAHKVYRENSWRGEQARFLDHVAALVQPLQQPA